MHALLVCTLVCLFAPAAAAAQAPTASFTATPNPATVGRVVTLNASASTNAVQYHWEWQDENGNWMRSGSGAQIQTSWSQPGTYQIHMWVYSSQNARADAYGTVTVHPNMVPTPVITINPSPGSVGQPVTLDGTSSYDAEGPITGHYWEWQDVSGNWYGSSHSSAVQVTWSQAGTYGVNLYVYDGNNQQGKTSKTVTVAARGAPSLSLAPHHNGFRDVTQGSATLSYTTPAYVSMDQPRSVTLFYASGQAAPTGFVQLDASINAAEAPTKMSIEIRNSANAIVAPETFYSAGNGTTRLAAQWDASGTPTGARMYTAVVRTYWPTEVVETSIPVRVLIINESQSRVGGPGWGISGLQRLYLQQDGALVTNGDGTAVFFAASSGTYAAPEGEFSTLGAGPTVDTYARTYPDGTRVTFSLSGLMTSVADRFGNATQFAWTTSADAAASIPTTITDPVGKQTTLAYLSGNYLGSVTDPIGRVSQVQYNGTRLLNVIGPDNQAALSNVSYTTGNRLSGWTARGGASWSVGYDAHGKLASIIAPQVSTTQAGVTQLIQPVTLVKSLEAAVLPTPGAGTNAAPATRVLPQNVRVETTDARGNTIKAAVDRFGSATRVEAPLGLTSIAERDAHSRVVRSVSPSGAVGRYTYVGSQLRQVVDSTTAQTVDYEYGPYDQVTRVWGSVPEVRYFYGPLGRLDSTRVVSTGARTLYSYHSDGRVNTVTDAGGHGVTYGYDAIENTTSTTAGSRVSSYLRDAYGRVIRSRNPANQRDSVTYDILNRVERTWNPANEQTGYAYAAAGSLWKVTDAKGQVYQYNRNALGWTESEVDPRGQSLVFRYDRGGNLTERTDRRALTLRTTHDALGRPLTVTDVSATATTTFAYGPAGRWVSASNAESTDTVYYDVAGRLSREVMGRPWGTKYVFGSTYNTQGQRTALHMTAPWTRSIGYGYNGAMQLTQVTDINGGTTQLAYTGESLLESTTLPGPPLHRIMNSYPSTHMSARTVYADSEAVDSILGVGYTQDRLGRVSYRWDGVGTERNGVSYDLSGRLNRYTTEKIFVDPACTLEQSWDEEAGISYAVRGDSFRCNPVWSTRQSASWTYDAVGNRTGTGITTENGNRLTALGGTSLTYDNDGNLAGKSATNLTRGFTWNALGQLTSVTTNGQTTTYGYDGFGRRVRKTSPTGTIRYLHDGDNLFMELDGNGTPVREYTFYPGVDRPHSVVSGGQVYYYTMEKPGNVSGLLNGSFQVVNRYRYDPWGNLSAANSLETVAQPLRYGAREWDAESGLVYLRNRYYDPGLGRFISEDPIGLAGGINLYAYAENDPVNRNDPYGLCPIRYCLETLPVTGDPRCTDSTWTRGDDNECRPPHGVGVPPRGPTGRDSGDGSGGRSRPRPTPGNGVDVPEEDPGDRCTNAGNAAAVSFLLDGLFLYGVAPAATQAAAPTVTQLLRSGTLTPTTVRSAGNNFAGDAAREKLTIAGLTVGLKGIQAYYDGKSWTEIAVRSTPIIGSVDRLFETYAICYMDPNAKWW